MRRERRSVVDEEQGAALVIFTLGLAAMIGMAAFMLDIGYLYWQGLEVQHGADAAALAGVIYEPDLPVVAETQALAAAGQNGYHSGVAVCDASKIASGACASGEVDNQHQLRVTITHQAETFFMKFFGIDTVDITRTAVAEYVLPLPLGSPESEFGNEPGTSESGWPNFWGNIHGYYTGRRMGDRFSSQCEGGGAGAGCSLNPERRPTSYSVGNEEDAQGGYLYGVEVDGSGGLTVEVFDGAFTRGGNDFTLMGDQPQGSNPGPTTVFMIFSPDPTPGILSDGNEHLCTLTFAPQDAWWTAYGTANTSSDFDNITWDMIPGNVIDDQWTAFPCNLDRGPGIYPIRVFTLDDGGQGLNRWALRAGGGSNPRVYGLGDMAIYSNVDGSTGNTIFYLAEVEEIHAGKILKIDLWDPGDASGNHSIRILSPQGSNSNFGGCSWTSTNPSYPSGSSNTTCDIATSNSRFNGHALEIRINLPSDYSCASDCWWKIDYNYPGTTNDTTTWSATILGDPVKLVE